MSKKKIKSMHYKHHMTTPHHVNKRLLPLKRQLHHMMGNYPAWRRQHIHHFARYKIDMDIIIIGN